MLWCTPQFQSPVQRYSAIGPDGAAYALGGDPRSSNSTVIGRHRTRLGYAVRSVTCLWCSNDHVLPACLWALEACVGATRCLGPCGCVQASSMPFGVCRLFGVRSPWRHSRGCCGHSGWTMTKHPAATSTLQRGSGRQLYKESSSPPFTQSPRRLQSAIPLLPTL